MAILRERRPPHARLYEPEIEKIVILRSGKDALWKITLVGEPSMTLPARQVIRYRVFHCRCLEVLLTVFDWVEYDRWFYKVLVGLSRGACDEAGGGA